MSAAIVSSILVALLLADSPAPGAPAGDAVRTWFGSQTCPALETFSSTKKPPAVKTGSEELIVKIPQSALAQVKQSATVPWYVYDPHMHAAFSHIGVDSGVVETLRLVNGPPPEALPNVDLGDARTRSGLKLGSSAALVVSTLGKPLIVRQCGMERYEYNDTKDPNAEPNDLDFTIKAGRVIEIVHTVWG